MSPDQDLRISEVVRRERSRLLGFIRRRIPDPSEAEDLMQDVFYELVQANRLLMPIEHVTAWMFRVARNRIIDILRAKEPEKFDETDTRVEDGELHRLEELLPSPDAGPEAARVRRAFLDDLASAVAELPAEQREVFLAHEIEGRSFKEMAAATGVSVNTLQSRKRYAVLRLRHRLREVYEELRKS